MEPFNNVPFPCWPRLQSGTEKGHLFKVNVLAFCDGECICLDLENNIIKMGLVLKKLRAASRSVKKKMKICFLRT